MEQQARLLIVDDSEDNRVLLSGRLKRNGYRCETAVSGEEALARLACENFDLVLLDLVLPGASGVDVLTRIRGAHPLAKLPVIMVTAQQDADAAVEALGLGANDYVTMPCDLRLLMARIALHLRAKQAEEALVEAQQVLEQRVEERTEELRAKNVRLSELYASAHQFVDNVSHEFRTPLTVIKEFASILADELSGPVNDDQREYLGIIQNRIDDLSLMVDDMLDTSRLEAGLLSVYRTEHTVAEIVDRVRTIVERKAQAAGVNLIVDTPGDRLPTVYCDAENIGRVIVNLVVNACKFAGEGSNVELGYTYDPTRSEVAFRVSDTGPGIAPEQLQGIFERFQQAGNDTKSSGKGFGLGLNIAKELVHVNLGSISVESELGQGSTFSFSVPAFDPIEVAKRYLRHKDARRPNGATVTLSRMSAGEEVPETSRDAIEQFLHHHTRSRDIVFRLTNQEWLILTYANREQIAKLEQRLSDSRQLRNRTSPDAPLPPFEFRHMVSAELAAPEGLLEVLRSEWSIKNNDNKEETRHAGFERLSA